MIQNTEKAMLLSLLKRLDTPEPSIFIRRWFLPVAWLVMVVGFTALFQLAHSLNPLVFALCAAFLGALGTWASFLARDARGFEP